MFGFLFFLALTLLAGLILVIFLLRAGAARGMTVWALAALLPVLAAMTAANAGQARAGRVLRNYQAQSATVTVTTWGQPYTLTLDAENAACLERATRLRSEFDLHTPEGQIVPIREETQVTGQLPPPEVVQALSVQGSLMCTHFGPPRLQAAP